MKKISIVTATLNSALSIQRLINSIQSQTSNDFEWVIVDGGSTDGTLEILNKIDDVDINIISEPDFGIYDALNKGILKTKSEYYLVVGSDDKLMPNAIDKYISCLQEEPEIVTASVLYQGGIHRPRKRFISILNDVWSYVSCHSVGCLFKKNLHEKYGMYSNRFPIAADQYFLKKAIVGGVKIIKADFIAGEFGLCGVSSTDLKGHL